jgi:citrate lyase subunit beta/citryl-CoA lyase
VSGRLGLGPALLFCPADRPERFGKALERADAVILDLEDGVASADRHRAREAIVAFGRSLGETDQVSGDWAPDRAASGVVMRELSARDGVAHERSARDGVAHERSASHGSAPSDVARTVVRVNAVGSADIADDLAAVAATPFRTVMLAKAESSEQLDVLADALDGVRVIALCETARGVLAAPELARHPAVGALMWGAEDLVVSLGGASSRMPDGTYREVARHARSAVLLAAGAAEVDAIDAVHIDLDDLDGLAVEARDAVASGFAATACLHPRQVGVVRAAYRPTDDEVASALAVLAAADGSQGAFRHEGRMIDEPLIAQARAVLRRAGEERREPPRA